MKKRVLAIFLAAFAAVGMTACGGKEVATQEVDYDMTFENQTGIDVSKLEIRYAEDADWSEIALTDGNYYTLSQLYPEEVLNYYREQGGSAHLEYVFGNGYSIFGQVFEGLETVDAIAAAETDETDKPVKDITIESITFESYAAQ